jgi:hypothetical protein
MTVRKKQLDEKLMTGGGATGVSQTADPIDVKATLPASNLGNGEPMPRIAAVTPGQGEEETDPENNVKTTMDASASNRASVSMKEDIDAMFNGADLSEEFKEQATVIFEAAVVARVNEVVADLEEQYNTALESEVGKIQEDLTTKIDQYLDYVVEQWMEENKVAIEHSLRTEITEGFINGLRGLFEEHYMDIPDAKIDVVEELQAEMAEMQERLDSVMQENMELLGHLSEATKESILADMAEGLTVTQAEKLLTLSEGVEFDSPESFRRKLEIVKENYFPSEKTSSKQQNLFEEVTEEGQTETVQTNSIVEKYATAISRSVKK